ncbi:efflux RND transporter permease subunit [Ahrensia kielensis]|uniref:Efflux RND transporter permease subunit n=1 Tax=Ahrensia kielensis TaxID=76980 RepID=A0ABU9T2M4_9HYPH
MNMPHTNPRSLISTFIRHPNAANLLMVLMILFGVFALARINTQFFPTIETSNINVSVSWSGASAEDVERNILAVAEPSVRYIEGVKEMTSYANEGSATIRLEFQDGYNMQTAMRDVETAVKALSTLPEDAGDPKVSTSAWFDRVASISIAGDIPEAELRKWAKRIRDDLIERGIEKVNFTGLRDLELKVILPESELRRRNLSISDVSQAISANSRDLPSGNLDGGIERQLRTVSNVDTARQLADIEVKAFSSGEKIRIGDIAEVTDGFEDGGVRGFSNQKPAIELDIQSGATADTLQTNQILTDYLSEIKSEIPSTIELQTYEVRADAVSDRIWLLVRNGLSGLLLVVIILFIFLDARIALWVAAGIPVALLATIGLIYVFGETINMFSLFGLIMMLGVIVDDAIVVGEHTDTMLGLGDDPITAAENGVGQMLTPVTAAIITTIAAFAPILLITGGIGQIMGVLPIVVIAVALSSMIECFFILPGHLSHALRAQKAPRFSFWRMFIIALILALFVGAFLSRNAGTGMTVVASPIMQQIEIWQDETDPLLFATAVALSAMVLAGLVEACVLFVRNGFGLRSILRSGEQNWFRRNFDQGFEWFKSKPFNWIVTLSFKWRYVTVAIAVAMILIFARGLTAGGHVGFVFFPSPESENISGNITFHPGTPESETIRAIAKYEQALRDAEASVGGEEKLIRATFVTLGSSGRSQGDNLARIKVQLSSSETRTVRTPDFVREWQKFAPDLPSVRRFSVRQGRGGPQGADIDVQLKGTSIGVLKEAATEVSAIIAAIPGVSGVEDDLPYGKPELLMTMKPRGSALGFTLDDVGRQVRNAIEGSIPRRFARGDDEVTVRVMQTMGENGTAALRSMQLTSPAGNNVPLLELVDLHEQQGFSTIQRRDGKTTISVSGDIDAAVNTTDGVVERLTASGALETVARKYGISYEFGGRSREQRDAFRDLQLGTIIALSVIYIVLAWVFGSYFKPLAVMLIIPFGVVGAVIGHYLLGFQLTILSMIGLLGLSGILVNDSIILVSRLDERQKMGDSIAEAAIGASRDRLRAVLLTSLTTIGGLVPLLFEKSIQAQLLMPMAITMVFGLATATLLVLFLVPAIVGIGYDFTNSLVAIYGSSKQPRKTDDPIAGE